VGSSHSHESHGVYKSVATIALAGLLGVGIVSGVPVIQPAVAVTESQIEATQPAAVATDTQMEIIQPAAAAMESHIEYMNAVTEAHIEFMAAAADTQIDGIVTTIGNKENWNYLKEDSSNIGAATKEDLNNLKETMATKEDLNKATKATKATMATKEDLNNLKVTMATKEDLNNLKATMKEELKATNNAVGALDNKFGGLINEIGGLTTQIAASGNTNTLVQVIASAITALIAFFISNTLKDESKLFTTKTIEDKLSAEIAASETKFSRGYSLLSVFVLLIAVLIK
jgi:hypothetical protein